jgi:hypothetical protein
MRAELTFVAALSICMLPSGVSAFALFFADNSLLYDSSSRSERLAEGLIP